MKINKFIPIFSPLVPKFLNLVLLVVMAIAPLHAMEQDPGQNLALLVQVAQKALETQIAQERAAQATDAASVQPSYPMCGKDVKKSGDLTIPISILGKKVFKCEDCGKLFRQRSHLKRHESLHAGEKSFKCKAPDCQYSCNQRGNLKVHEKIHTGNKLFHCNEPGCNYFCRSACCLTEHKKNAHIAKKC